MVAYHGPTKGGTSAVLIPGAPFSTNGPATEVSAKNEDEASPQYPRGRSTRAFSIRPSGSSLRPAVAARRLGSAAAQAPGPAGAAAQKYATPVETDEWLNFTAPGYSVPAVETTYACNVSAGHIPVLPLTSVRPCTALSCLYSTVFDAVVPCTLHCCTHRNILSFFTG